MACRCKKGRTGTQTRACKSQSQYIVAPAHEVCPIPAVCSWPCTYCLPTPKFSSTPATHEPGVIIHLTNEEIWAHKFQEPVRGSKRQNGLQGPVGAWILLPDLPSVYLLDDGCIGPCSGLPMSSLWYWGWGWELFLLEGRRFWTQWLWSLTPLSASFLVLFRHLCSYKNFHIFCDLGP